MKKIVLKLFIGIMLATGPMQNIQAAQTRTYIEDMHGRTLIYPSEKSLWDLALSIPIAVTGVGLVYLGYKEHTYNNIPWLGYSDNDFSPLVTSITGTFLTIFGTVFTYAIYQNNSNLHKPIIMLTKKGIWYRGSMKYNWDEISEINLVNLETRDQYGKFISFDLIVRVNLKSHNHFWNIYTDQVAISREKLHQLMSKYWHASKLNNHKE
jgi:hypothetical protein